MAASRKPQRPARRRRRLAAALLTGLLLLFIAYEGWFAARIWRLRSHNPQTTAFMTERLALLRRADPGARLTRHWVPYNRISPWLKRAVVAAEDAKFVEHDGFDWDGIQVALKKDLHEGEFVAGGSTISQQLAKNLFLSAERSLLRKGQEAILTVMLETLLSKRRILELYLNVIEWGDGLFGADAAAHQYFGTGADRLDPSQSAWLAAIIPNPRYYYRTGYTPVLGRRAAVIAERLGRARIP